MAWPFSTAGAPNFDTGPGITIPVTPAAVLLVGNGWLLGAHLTNTAATEVTITITDTADTIVSEVVIPGGSEQLYDWPFRPVNGVKISATMTGALAHVWGYQ